MAIESLDFGESVAGLLVDGVEDTPYTGATLRMERPRGVVVEVPYIPHDETGQFRHVDEWFQTRTPPLNMHLATPDGPVGLFGIKWRGHSVRSGVSLGRLAPSETVFGHCEAPLSEPLVLTEVQSHLDGLREWTRFTSIDTENETTDDGLAAGVLIRVRSGGEIKWQQEEATMRFLADWGTQLPDDDPHGGLNISDRSALTSTFPSERPFDDHLREQRKVVHLLTLIAGKPIHFRRHRVSAESIVARSAGGTILYRPHADLISRHTVDEHAQPRPAERDMDDMLTHLPDVGPEGLTRWGEQYERWRRFILPAAGVLGRKGAFAEDIITSTSMAIEAAGHIIGPREGEVVTYSERRKVTTSTYVYRCLHLLDVQWGNLVPDVGALASAVANTYNAIKHFDRGEFPEAAVSFTISLVNRYIVRLLALHIIDEGGELLAQYRRPGALYRVEQYSTGYGLTFSEQGRPLIKG